VSLRKRIVNEHLLNPKEFWCNYTVPSVACNEPSIDKEDMWRGPVWAPLIYMLGEGLMACGENEMAKDVAEKFFNNVAKSGISEYFDPVTGEGIGDPGYSWTAAIYLEFVNLFSVNAKTK
jgi:putative isomerase